LFGFFCPHPIRLIKTFAVGFFVAKNVKHMSPNSRVDYDTCFLGNNIQEVMSYKKFYAAMGINSDWVKNYHNLILENNSCGKKPHFNHIIDKINYLSTYTTAKSTISYDYADLAGKTINFRLGRDDEWFAGRSLKNLPVICCDQEVFGSPVKSHNLSPVTENTRDILTVIYSYSGIAMLEQHFCAAILAHQKYANTTVYLGHIQQEALGCDFDAQVLSDMIYKDNFIAFN
jgi:DNA/RNA-binding domain of Phe-tRNA-synthetase-like protein